MLSAFDMGGADEFGAAPEFGARAGGENFGDRFAAPDQRAGIGFKARSRLDRHGFAGQRRLVDEHGALDQAHVGGHDRAKRQLDDVAPHKFGRRQRLPGAVAPRGSGDRETRLERIERRLRAAFLKEPERSIE